MDIINSSNYQITLGSGSSRRKELLEMTGIKFDINSNPVNEDFPDTLRSKEIAEFIVTKKTNSFRELVKENQIIITADTLVWFEEKCWGKPKDKMEAKKMLKMFGGVSHAIIGMPEAEASKIGKLFDSYRAAEITNLDCL